MTTTPSQITPAEEDQLWQAFCYVHGELSADEAEQFELQMLDDAELCALVADTSLLTAAIAATDQRPRQRPVSPAVSHPAVAVRDTVSIAHYLAVTSVVCCCAVAAVILARNEFRTPGAVTVSTGSSDAAFLVNAWADGRTPETEPDATDPESADDDDLVVPDWMLAALSADDIAEPAEPSSDVDNPDSPELLQERS